MTKIKLTKSDVDAAQPRAQAVELRDTALPGFLCKINPALTAPSPGLTGFDPLAAGPA